VVPRGPGNHSKADLHLHTARGDGMAAPSQLLDYVEEHTDLDLIAVTDHDQLESSLEARDLHARRGGFHFDVITGTEITTIEGHILALAIEDPVPSFRTLAATLDAVHKQGGICLIPHPMSWMTRSVGRHGIERVLERRPAGLWFDGIELSNQSPAGRSMRHRVRRLNEQRFGLPVGGGSDAHYLAVLGTAWTSFQGEGLPGLRASLEAGTTWAEQRLPPRLRDLGYGQVLRQSWRGLGATPKRVILSTLHRARRLR
jgi:predicted metal-dependent phosphoesterase TrpH